MTELELTRALRDIADEPDQLVRQMAASILLELLRPAVQPNQTATIVRLSGRYARLAVVEAAAADDDEPDAAD